MNDDEYVDVLRSEKCGAVSPWGTECTRDRDHNDHTNHAAPRWWSGLDDVAERDARIAELKDRLAQRDALVGAARAVVEKVDGLKLGDRTHRGEYFGYGVADALDTLADRVREVGTDG